MVDRGARYLYRKLNGGFRRIEHALPKVRPPFALHPAIRPVADWRLRRDPRDRLNLLCDISDWRDGPMLAVLAELREPIRIHRKAWEFGKCLNGLQRLDMIRPDARGVSVGAGRERPLFWLADHIDRIVATDLYESEDGKWGWGAQFMRDREGYWPYRKDHLEVHNMSGLELEFPDASFDFAYSLSSIEHFGGHDAARRSVREMARVVKPGGVVCLVTELMLSSRPMAERFTWEELHEYVIEGNGLTLIEPEIDLRISESLLAHPHDMFDDPDDVSPTIVMAEWKVARSVWGSIILFFRR